MIQACCFFAGYVTIDNLMFFFVSVFMFHVIASFMEVYNMSHT